MKIFFLTVTVFIQFLSTHAMANVLYEGWFEVVLGQHKVGYLVERYEFTGEKFKSTYYLKTNADGGNITESLKAFAANDLSPLSYSYTAKVDKDIKVIDATFTDPNPDCKPDKVRKGQECKPLVMTATINDGKKESKSITRVKKGSIVSTFLLYLIMSQKNGLAEGNDYSYFAVAEEDTNVYSGTAKVSTLEKVKGRDAFKILNSFKGENFFTWITPKGEILLTRSPDKNIDVRTVDGQAEATKGMAYNAQDIQLLFNKKIPGENSISNQRDDKEQLAPKQSAAQKTEEKKKKLFEKHPVKEGKKAGVPGGLGIEIKGIPPPPSTGSVPAEPSSPEK